MSRCGDDLRYANYQDAVAFAFRLLGLPGTGEDGEAVTIHHTGSYKDKDDCHRCSMEAGWRTEEGVRRVSVEVEQRAERVGVIVDFNSYERDCDGPFEVFQQYMYRNGTFRCLTRSQRDHYAEAAGY